MSYSYKTIDYFKDSLWLFDWISGNLEKAIKKVKVIFRSTTSTDVESSILRIIENLPYGIFILFLGFFLTVFLIRVTENEKGVKVFTITTGSMEPAVKPGSMLFSHPQTNYQVGDVVNYKEKYQKNNNYTGRVLTHRILDISVADGFYIYKLKGDNNENPDPGEIKTTDITGKVFLVLPFMGYIDFLLRTIPGFLIFIVLPSILLIKEARGYILQKDA